MGGLVVGLVTKYAGGVVKGFALIAGTAKFQHLVLKSIAVSRIQLKSATDLFRHKNVLHFSGLIVTALAQWIVESKALAFKDW